MHGHRVGFHCALHRCCGGFGAAASGENPFPTFDGEGVLAFSASGRPFRALLDRVARDGLQAKRINYPKRLTAAECMTRLQRSNDIFELRRIERYVLNWMIDWKSRKSLVERCGSPAIQVIRDKSQIAEVRGVYVFSVKLCDDRLGHSSHIA